MNKKEDSLKSSIVGKEYFETDKSFVIPNVPIMAEMVQPYSDGFALKSMGELRKVKLDGVRVTIVKDSPTHPEFLGTSPTLYQEEVVNGYLSNPSTPKKDADPTKIYADMVLDKNDLTRKLVDKYSRGEIIDVSIGFYNKQDNNSGIFKGVRYDYVQRDIVLDHLAILMDEQGNIGVGRMPSPVGGIGADSGNQDHKQKIKGDKMEKNNDAILAENVKLKQELESINADLQKKADADMKKAKDEMKKTIDSLTQENQKVKDELEESKEKLEAAEKVVKEVEEKKAEEVKEMKDSLIKKNPEMEAMIAEAKDETVRELFKKQKETDGNEYHIGADMMGSSDRETSKSTAGWISQSKPKKE